MSDAALILLELHRRFMYAARENREQDRSRLFDLIEEFRWAFPEAAREVDSAYGGQADAE